MSTPVIIEAAINGVTAPERNPSVPRSPAEIAADAVRCLAAGAAIVHSHIAEFALDGARAAELYLEAWRPVLRERPDAILYPTAGAGATIAERYAHEVLLAEAGVLRMGLVDPGSVNLGGADEHGLPLPIDYVYVNSYRDILYEVELCARYRLGPSISIFEPGFLRVALAFQRARRLPRGALVKLYFGGGEGYLGGTGGALCLPPTAPRPEGFIENVALGVRFEGHAQIAAQYAALFHAFPDAEMVQEGEAFGTDVLVAWGVFRGTMRGPFLGAAPTGRRIAIPFVNVVPFRDGLMQGERAYFDVATLCAQAGLALEDLRASGRSLPR